MSSGCSPSATLVRQASITHCVETCLATIYAHGNKLFPSAWMAFGLQPLAYPLQIAAKSSSRWCIATDVSTLDVLYNIPLVMSSHTSSRTSASRTAGVLVLGADPKTSETTTWATLRS